MGHTTGFPDLERAEHFLASHVGEAVSDVELVGEGMWSRAFGFVHEGRPRVVRFGRHRDDYEKDQRVATFASARLPVPRVLEIGRGPNGGWFCIAERAYGDPLEHLDTAGWRAVLPSLLDVYDRLRALEIAPNTGWGGWGPDGCAPMASWRDFLLAVALDDPSRRTHGWRQRLLESAFGDGAFRVAEAQLDALTRSLRGFDRAVVHADLINRNVLVDDGRITAVLDWGCSIYGDFLYELAWMQFWLPWYPSMVEADVVGTITRHLETRERGQRDLDARLTACLLHIGLDHIAYNAWTGDMETLGRVIDRTMEFVD